MPARVHYRLSYTANAGAISEHMGLPSSSKVIAKLSDIKHSRQLFTGK